MNHQKNAQDMIYIILLKGSVMLSIVYFCVTTFGRNNNQALLFGHMATFFTMHSLMLVQIFVIGGLILRLNLLSDQLKHIFDFAACDLRVKLVINEDYTLEAVRGSLLVFGELKKASNFANTIFAAAVSFDIFFYKLDK